MPKSSPRLKGTAHSISPPFTRHSMSSMRLGRSITRLYPNRWHFATSATAMTTHRSASVTSTDSSRDCADGSLPNYAFIEPKQWSLTSGQCNDTHPPHDVLLGD